jgi:hypothetical protein
MKTNTKYVITLTTVGIATAIACIAGPTIIINPPSVIVSAPPPAVVVPVPVVAPDYYTWDGYEYVGVVGDQYYYLGSGNVWVVMDPMRLERFHTWAGRHSDWRDHATHNVLYRNINRHDQPQPMHDDRSVHSQPMERPQPQQPNPAPHASHYPPQ